MSTRMDVDQVTTVCREFCQVLGDVMEDEDLTPEDCWDPIVTVLGPKFDRETLEQLDDEKIDALRRELSAWLECGIITVDHVKRAVAGTLATW